MNYYLAIDLGASSGRHVVGHSENGEVVLDEIYRFSNAMEEREGHLTWNVNRLFAEILIGIKKALMTYPHIDSLAIDSWAVDYVLMDGDREIWPCFAYRDLRTKAVVDLVHAAVPFEKLYEKTGIQFQPFNSVYQLYADRLEGRLDQATDFLMIPEYLNYRLTGKKMKEFTNATSTGLINADTHAFDEEIIQTLRLPRRLFPKTRQTELVGMLTEEIADLVGGQIPVVLCASHDTASAVEGISMTRNSPYISSGTWSLLGILQDRAHREESSRRDNFSNEGVLGQRFRFQKNIMGLWIIQCVQKEFNDAYSFEQLVELARRSAYETTFDVNDPGFLSPANMTETIYDELRKQHQPLPVTPGDLANCVFRSLALSYKIAIGQMESILGERFSELYIVGGGAKNAHLNQLTEQFTGKKVIALPIEATAAGNIAVQIRRSHEQI